MAINFPDSPSTNDLWTVGSNTWSFDGEKWVLVAGTIYLDDLTDVSASAPATGEFLKWDGSAWVPASIPSINFLDDIGDVSTSTAVSGQVLTYNGSAWVNQNASSGGFGFIDGGAAATVYDNPDSNIDGGAAA